jgi:uncharacterized protein
MEQSIKSKCGFAAMDPEKQRDIARMGGRSVPNEKRSFSKDSELAATAGRKGGQSLDPAKRSFSMNHALAAKAGQKGGLRSHTGRRGANGIFPWCCPKIKTAPAARSMARLSYYIFGEFLVALRGIERRTSAVSLQRDSQQMRIEKRVFPSLRQRR